MCGVPGAGKSYVAKNLLMRGNGWRYISRDEIRCEILEEDEEHFSHEDEVFDVFTYKIEQAIKDDEVNNIIADATHLHWPSRRKLLTGIGQMHNPTVNIIPVFVMCDGEMAFQRNAARRGRQYVPERAFNSMNEALRHPKNDPFKYTAIMEVYNGGDR